MMGPGSQAGAPAPPPPPTRPGALGVHGLRGRRRRRLRGGARGGGRNGRLAAAAPHGKALKLGGLQLGLREGVRGRQFPDVLRGIGEVGREEQRVPVVHQVGSPQGPARLEDHRRRCVGVVGREAVLPEVEPLP